MKGETEAENAAVVRDVIRMVVRGEHRDVEGQAKGQGHGYFLVRLEHVPAFKPVP
jgi:hypothetical protein